MSKHDKNEGLHAEKVQRKGAQTAKTRWNDIYDDNIIVLQSHNSGSAACLRRLAALVAVFLIFKGLVIAYVGGWVYTQAVEKLSTGNLFEKAGAFLMYPDFASSTVASLLMQLVY